MCCVCCEIIYSSLPTLNLLGPLATAALAKDPHQYQHHLHHHPLIPFSAYIIKSLTPTVSAQLQQALPHCSCCPRAHLLSLTKHNNDTSDSLLHRLDNEPRSFSSDNINCLSWPSIRSLLPPLPPPAPRHRFLFVRHPPVHPPPLSPPALP